MQYLDTHTFNLQAPVKTGSAHKPRVLILYGSLRANSISKKVAIEAGNILTDMGAEVRYFNPQGLPVFDHGESAEHPKVIELRDLVTWSEAQVWSSPELHGNMSAALKNQIDWIPLSIGAVRPTQGKVLAVMQVSGGSQSFNAVNNMRILGRWMRMLTIPNQSSVAKAYNEFNDDGSMRASSYRDRVVDVMEELMRFTYLTRDNKDFLVDRYSERKAQVTPQTEMPPAMADILEQKTPSVEAKQMSCC
ncbi:arsenical resistance protein ArsH [Pseudoalteromonas luteoviolacea]|uniref:arsenical resistance protein ArsH n=1 Tax=Pseudoalteromonas luteoviolacea TaxID=43657 RepID=UPI001B39F1EF|nr:arsenical resistance protein ArsH [Pseudoalteromonas luteoviolacea]MBQ4880039.1 arsenical resistance protein ArsH [Pseudoalteromonas luteoviolacea]MBQ4909056.1 arsenical resistance protein ArsH [Pseudoalteromonas luteoviolacea]